jgi:hypothetical protein
MREDKHTVCGLMVDVLVAGDARLAVQWVEAVLQYFPACRVTGDTFITIKPNIYMEGLKS